MSTGLKLREGAGSAGKGRLAGRTRGLPTARAAGASRVPCPALAPLSLGHWAPQRSYAPESERSQPALRWLHTPRYITHRREAPAAAVASALPRLGPPRPWRTPPPAQPPLPARPPAGRPDARGSPSSTTAAGGCRPRRASLCGSRPLLWVAGACACRVSQYRTPPSSSDLPVIALPGLATFANRGTVDVAADDQALRKTARRSGVKGPRHHSRGGGAGLRGRGPLTARRGGRQ